MSNVSITQKCNRSCDYCFAEDVMSGTPRASAFMSTSEFDAALDFLERSGLQELTLLGGEPTIHPEFTAIVDRAVERGFRVLVLSGGLVPDASLRYLAAADADQVGLMLNVLPPATGSERERNGQAEVMACLGHKVVLGLNIDTPGVALDFLLELIDGYELQRVVRLGIAHPIAGGNNAFLAPAHYPAVGRRVARFAFRARERSVRIGFDCGWVPCMFPEGTLAELGLDSDEVGRKCSPIIDILPGGSTISCYPLAALAREPLPARHDGAWLANQLDGRLIPYRRLTLYPHCTSCSWYRRGDCVGGCIASSMRRLRSAADAGGQP